MSGAVVVHVHDPEGYDVYIGRPNRTVPRQAEYPWKNPFLLSEEKGRDEVIALFRRYWYSPESAPVRERARQELAGKRLACWCKPKACHGDVIAEYVNSTQEVTDERAVE